MRDCVLIKVNDRLDKELGDKFGEFGFRVWRDDLDSILDGELKLGDFTSSMVQFAGRNVAMSLKDYEK